MIKNAVEDALSLTIFGGFPLTISFIPYYKSTNVYRLCI